MFSVVCNKKKQAKLKLKSLILFFEVMEISKVALLLELTFERL